MTYQQIMPLLRGITITEFQDFCGMIFELCSGRHSVAYFKAGVALHFRLHNYGIAENVAVDALYAARHTSVEALRYAEHYAEALYNFYVVLVQDILKARPIERVDIFLLWQQAVNAASTISLCVTP